MAVIAQSIFAAGLLFFSRDNRASNRLLSMLILALALWLIDQFMRISGIYNTAPKFYFTPLFYSLAFGPLIWFYVRSLINSDFRLHLRDFLHFIPVFVQSVLYWSLTFLPYQAKYWFWENVHKPYTYRLEFDATWVSLAIYVLFSLRLVRRYQHWLGDNYSETSLIRLNWLRVLLVVLIILCFQLFAELILRDFFGIYFRYDYSVQLLGLFVLMLGVGGLRQHSLGGIAYQEPQLEDYVDPFEPDPLITKKILMAMEQDKLYLNPTLSLNEFSSKLGLPARLVSKHINAGIGTSFNEFVNRYRVADVKRRLEKGDLKKFTLLSIAMESGFNSKTSFNRIFKEMEGIAPSKFFF